MTTQRPYPSQPLTPGAKSFLRSTLVALGVLITACIVGSSSCVRVDPGHVEADVAEALGQHGLGRGLGAQPGNGPGTVQQLEPVAALGVDHHDDVELEHVETALDLADVAEGLAVPALRRREVGDVEPHVVEAPGRAGLLRHGR